MQRWSGKVAVVTGASTGIGLATAKALVQNGLKVVGLARRKQLMEEGMSEVLKTYKGPGAFCAMQCDVTQESEVQDVFRQIKNMHGTVNVLVNNAGLLKSGTIADANIEDIKDTINLNVMGLIYCSRESIKLMKDNDQDAHLINIGSIAGHKVPQSIPEHSINVYAPSKFAVRAITETMRNELRGSKIRISHVSPGLVVTDIFDSAFSDETRNALFTQTPNLKSEDVANSILHIISTPEHVNITELTIKPLGETF